MGGQPSLVFENDRQCMLKDINTYKGPRKQLLSGAFFYLETDALMNKQINDLQVDEAPVQKVFEELVKDRAYFGENGGVTLSGGEILLQSEEAALLLKRLKEAGISTAVDTSGFCKKEDIDRVLPYTDVFLYDLKLADSLWHEGWTGVPNERIIENFEYLTQLRHTSRPDMGLWVRTPIIPGATDDEENIRDLARIVRDRADRWELCAFNNLCRDKYERMYKDWTFKETGLISREHMELLVAAALDEGAKNFRYTGKTRLEAKTHD